MKKFYIAISIVLNICAVTTNNLYAQNTQESIVEFQQKKLANKQEFDSKHMLHLTSYRDSINAQYAEFLKKKWESFRLFKNQCTFAPMPEPPIYNRKDSIPLSDVEIPIIGQEPQLPVTPPITIDPAPEPEPVESEKMITTNFFGTSIKINRTEIKLQNLSGVSENAVSAYWKFLSNTPIESYTDDILRLSQELSLDDWGIFQLSNTLFKSYFPGGTENEKVIFQTFLLNQLGYMAKIGRSGSNLFVLLATTNNLENTPYFIISKGGNSIQYYVINPKHNDLSEIQTCSAEYNSSKDNCKKMNLREISLPKLSNSIGTKKLHFEDKIYSIKYNQNIIDYYKTYPCVEFSIYANAPIDKLTQDCLKRELNTHINNKSQEAAVNFLLHWVQSSFSYQTDDEQFGYEKWNFAEETIASTHSDCDDRAILFAQLVKNLLGMDVVLIYYPGVHLAAAVHFDNPQTLGNYVVVDNRKFLICDPTYIGADIGMTMPNLNNISVNIIKLNTIN